MVDSMRPERRARMARAVGRRGWILGATVLLAGVALLGGLGPLASATPYGPGDPVSWTNGLVLCQFAASRPSVGVSALSLNNSGVTVSMLNVSEVGADQTVKAYASMETAVWQATNLSTDEAYDLAYSADVPVVSAAGTSPTVGSAKLSVSFVLPAYAGSPSGPADTVNVVFSVVNWSWLAPGDHLVVSFGATPSFPTEEHLSAATAAGWLLASSSTASGTELERIGAAATATAVSASGASVTVPANSSAVVSSPTSAQLAVAFGASAGEFTSLSFTAKVGIVLPSTVAGIPLTELAASGAAAVLVSLLVAATTRRLRKKPSKLIYVTEEENR